MSKTTKNTKCQILTAALEVVRRAGTPALTLDAVAEEAGLSKGGLLYNFPSKDALIRGMVEFLAGKFEAEIAAARENATDAASPTLAAMVDVTEGWLSEQRDVARAILPATADKPDLRQPFIDVKLRLRAAILEETSQYGAAWVIWTSLEGLHFSEAHCVSTLTDEDRTAVFEELRSRRKDLNQ